MGGFDFDISWLWGDNEKLDVKNPIFSNDELLETILSWNINIDSIEEISIEELDKPNCDIISEVKKGVFKIKLLKSNNKEDYIKYINKLDDEIYNQKTFGEYLLPDKYRLYKQNISEYNKIKLDYSKQEIKSDVLNMYVEASKMYILENYTIIDKGKKKPLKEKLDELIQMDSTEGKLNALLHYIEKNKEIYTIEYKKTNPEIEYPTRFGFPTKFIEGPTFCVSDMYLINLSCEYLGIKEIGLDGGGVNGGIQHNMSLINDGRGGFFIADDRKRFVKKLGRRETILDKHGNKLGKEKIFEIDHKKGIIKYYNIIITNGEGIKKSTYKKEVEYYKMGNTEKIFFSNNSYNYYADNQENRFDYLLKAYEIFPENTRANYWLGVEYLRDNLYDKAKFHFQNVKKINPYYKKEKIKTYLLDIPETKLEKETKNKTKEIYLKIKGFVQKSNNELNKSITIEEKNGKKVVYFGNRYFTIPEAYINSNFKIKINYYDNKDRVGSYEDFINSFINNKRAPKGEWN